jgi:(1->4)-alpha-D-glucan 1-alpha-D-glucosylmutase
MANYRVPAATYRLQFNRNFTFAAARALVPYLEELGITDIYASPLFQATHGSLHGYSVTNPMELNPELGPARSFEALTRSLMTRGMGLLFDIVPNHMALSSDNPWLMEVLEDGHGSPYTIFFDIDWRPPNRILEGKLLLPILGRPYGQVLEDQELRLSLEPGGFFFNYYEHKFPLTPKSYRQVLSPALGRLIRHLGEENPGTITLMGIISLITNLQSRPAGSGRKIKYRQRDKEIIKKSLWLLYRGSPEVQKILNETIETFNGQKGEPETFDALDRLLQQQHYRLAFWQVALELINYRRFFSVNDLIGLRIEDPEVFKSRHALLFKLVEEGKVSGLRIDHVDGLFDPLEYLQRLQQRFSSPGKTLSGTANLYILVEKILAPDETLPPEWPVAGTTGYDFLNQVNGVFIKAQGVRQLKEIYADFVEAAVRLPDLIIDKKKLILAAIFGGEVENLVYYLSLMAKYDRRARDIARRDLMEVLVEVMAALPIYRTYIRSLEVAPRDRGYLEEAFAVVRRRRPYLNQLALDFLHRVLCLELPPYLTEGQRRDWLKFVMHWQQLTGPVTAKGVEDTVLYIYNPLISLNEVGGSHQPVSAEIFHEFNQRQQQTCPHTLNATSTHDTKRSEDVRARLNVLSELPGEWEKCLSRWSALNSTKKFEVGGTPVPERNQEILLYQTMLGVWPLDPANLSAFKEQLKSYMVKAAREAMVHTRWISPQVEHEEALIAFVDAILDEAGNQEFWQDFLGMASRLAYFGALNSLSQVLLKMAAPGVPDFYQGTELWDFSLVDPDNRQPVDFTKRLRLLKELRLQEEKGRGLLAPRLLNHWQDGKLKLYVIYRTLNFRKTKPELFLQGGYLPLTATGNRGKNILAFARNWENHWVLAVAGRCFTEIAHPGQPPIGREAWGDSLLLLPPQAPVNWVDILTGKTYRVDGSAQSPSLPLHEIFAYLPVGLLSAST